MTVHSRSEIETIIQAHAKELRSLGVRRLGLFGSFLHDRQTDESDVDLLVEFEPGEKSFDHFMALSFRLEELLGRRVELITPEGMSPHIGPHIRREVQYVPIAA